MKRIAVIVVGMLVLAAYRSDSGEPGLTSVPAMAAPTERAENPHWNKNRCDLCHPRLDDGSLNPKAFVDPSIRANCDRCHSGKSLSEAMHHPYDITPSRLSPSPGEWPLVDGRLSCQTCHDILQQCELDLKERWRNASFLRSKPAEAAVEFCLRCHSGKLYRATSPHDQLDDQGQEREGVCLFCHEKRPDPQEPAEDGGTNLKSPVVELCGNCHGTFPHPIGIPHLRVVKREMLDRIVATELSDRYVIPVGQIQRYIAGEGRMPQSMRIDPETNETTCITCHNPHELGVLPPTLPDARGAEGDTAKNYRLRYPKGELCSCCHRI